jgi:predicted phage baseplate assembly protein
VALVQDPHAALPEARLSDGQTGWIPRHDLLSSGPQDAHFVVETDNEGFAHLRFGDGRLGREPALDRTLNAVYRVGGGSAGNVGADSISHLVLRDLTIDGLSVVVRNPMPARGGLDPEPIAEAKLLAPGAVRATLERAIIADDYARLAERDRKTTLQRASAQLAWTGSWYEADVAIDPWDKKAAGAELVDSIGEALYRYRRIGHDLRVLPAVSVPIALRLAVCAVSGHEPGHVKAALLTRFSNRRNPDGTRGFFHPDTLSFGEPIELSGIVAAARAVGGVGDVTVLELHRSLEPARHEIANGVLPIAANEIARLDNDPDHPERGWLQIDVEGGQ